MSAISTRVVPSPSPAVPAGSVPRAVLTTAPIALFLAAPLLITAQMTPKFVEIFKDFGVALPLAARLFISFNRVLATPWGVVASIALIGAVLAGVALLSYRWRLGALLAFGLCLALFILYMTLYVHAMYEPLVAMIQSLQTRPG